MFSSIFSTPSKVVKPIATAEIPPTPAEKIELGRLELQLNEQKYRQEVHKSAMKERSDRNDKYLAYAALLQKQIEATNKVSDEVAKNGAVVRHLVAEPPSIQPEGDPMTIAAAAFVPKTDSSVLAMEMGAFRSPIATPRRTLVHQLESEGADPSSIAAAFVPETDSSVSVVDMEACGSPLALANQLEGEDSGEESPDWLLASNIDLKKKLTVGFLKELDTLDILDTKTLGSQIYERCEVLHLVEAVQGEPNSILLSNAVLIQLIKLVSGNKPRSSMVKCELVDALRALFK